MACVGLYQQFVDVTNGLVRECGMIVVSEVEMDGVGKLAWW